MRINVFRAVAEIAAVLMASFAGLYASASFFGDVFAAPFGMLAGVAVSILFIKLRGERLSAFGFRPAGLVTSLALTVAIVAWAVAIYLFLEPSLVERFGPIDLSVFERLEGDLGLYLLLLSAAWVGAAFGEEVVYRGFIMTRVSQMFSLSAIGWVFAIAFQAAVFAFAHSYQGVVGMIEIFVLSLALGGAYLAAGRSLAPLILAHGVLDTMGVTDFYLGGQMID